jgi:hypothetical protein
MLYGGRPVIGFGDAPCPSNPPPRAGYAVWRGPVPKELTQWAMMLRDHVAAFPYGQEWTMRWMGTNVVARKDFHRWTYQGGQLVTGLCIPGITLYRPPPPAHGLDAALVLDPATAVPDPQLAVFDVPLTPPERPSWGLVAASVAAIGATAGLFWWGLYTAGRR